LGWIHGTRVRPMRGRLTAIAGVTLDLFDAVVALFVTALTYSGF
jgi:hypothetical protein